MDLNYLLHRHQVSLIRAEAAVRIEPRRAHQMLAALYARQIEAFRQMRMPRGSALGRPTRLNAGRV